MSVVAWGYGKSGALGTGENVDQSSPVVVAGQLRGKHVLSGSLTLTFFGYCFTYLLFHC